MLLSSLTSGYVVAGCVMQLEDDIAIITGKLGAIPALNGNSISTATVLVPTVTGTTASATATGIVAKTGVSDFFSFTAAAAGTATVTGQVRAQVWFGSWCFRRSASNCIDQPHR